MSIPTPARTPAQSQTRSHGTPVPPGTAGLWIAPAVWKTRTIRSRLNAPAPRRVFHTALDCEHDYAAVRPVLTLPWTDLRVICADLSARSGSTVGCCLAGRQ